MPQPSDLRLAAALVVKGYATREAIEECLKIQEKYAAAGKPISFERVVVGKGVAKDTLVRHVRRGEGLLLPGEKIGEYALVRKIGEGGMSYVFEATAPGAKTSVALKVMKPHLARDAAACVRFRNEANLLIRFEHPNLTRGVSLGEVDEAPYFVMEFVDGDTILNIVEQSGTFGEDAALYIVMQIADALDYLFSQGIVHRDVKPANILLKRDNTVKLCDLGLAAEIKTADATSSAEESRSDTTVGTVHYISPEQAAGQTDVDVRSDIYSLGVTLYHIVVGELPFAGSNDSDVMRRQILEGLSASRLKGKDVSPHMHYFLEKMMAKERNVRYQSPRELVEDIREHIRGKKTLTFNPRYANAADVGVEKPYGGDAAAPTPAKKARDAGSKSSFFRFRRGRGPS